jgi:hypothetical protein
MKEEERRIIAAHGISRGYPHIGLGDTSTLMLRITHIKQRQP